jgi:hypothetical protein
VDRNVIKKLAENILTHKKLTTEIQRMWNVKIEMVPVLTGANGTISQSFRKYLSNIPGKQDIKELQKKPYWALNTYCGNANVKGQNIQHEKYHYLCHDC